jgi:hypothetical protein
MVGGSARKSTVRKKEARQYCLQRHSIGHGVINTLQIKGNQVAYQKKGYIMMNKRME